MCNEYGYILKNCGFSKYLFKRHPVTYVIRCNFRINNAGYQICKNILKNLNIILKYNFQMLSSSFKITQEIFESPCRIFTLDCIKERSFKRHPVHINVINGLVFLVSGVFQIDLQKNENFHFIIKQLFNPSSLTCFHSMG